MCVHYPQHSSSSHRTLLDEPGVWSLSLGGPCGCEWPGCAWLLLLPLALPRASAYLLAVLPGQVPVGVLTPTLASLLLLLPCNDPNSGKNHQVCQQHVGRAEALRRECHRSWVGEGAGRRSGHWVGSRLPLSTSHSRGPCSLGTLQPGYPIACVPYSLGTLSLGFLYLGALQPGHPESFH